jgi:hypothetical protein
MRHVIVTDNDGYTEGWTAAAQEIRSREDAESILRYLSLNPPSDSFDQGAFDAALVALGR